MMTSSNRNISALLALCAVNSPVTGEFPYKGQWRGALIFSLICAWTNDWANNRNGGDLRRYRARYDVTVMQAYWCMWCVHNKAMYVQANRPLHWFWIHYFDWLVQERRNSSALAMDLRLSCTNPSIYGRQGDMPYWYVETCACVVWNTIAINLLVKTQINLCHC